MVEEHVQGFATVCMDECAPRQMSGLEDEDPTTSSSHHSEAQLVASELAAQASAANDTSSAPSSDAEQLCADDSDIAQPESPKSSSSGIFQLQRELPPPLTVAAAALMTISDPGVVVRRLRQENERLQAEVTRLRRLVISGAAAAQQRASAEADDERAEGYAGTSQDGEMASDGGGSSGGGAGTSSSSRVRSLEAELRLAREALGALRADRKRLRAEKFELLEQTKELYGTLEERERELREFIRSYEQRARESESSLQQLSTEREERERERWSLLRHARDEAERSLSLAAQLNAKELQLRRAHEQLREARRQLGCCLSDQETTRGDATPGSLIPGDRGSCSADSGVRGCSDRETNLSDSTTDGATPTITLDGARHVDMDTISLVSSIATTTTAPPQSSGGLYQLSTRDCSPSLSPLNAFSRSVEQLSSPLESEPPAAIATTSRRPKTGAQSRTGSRGGTWGSISRVFARSRHRSKAGSTASGMSGASALGSGGGGGSSIDGGSEHGDENGAASYRSWSPLTEEGYAEKLRLLREAAAVPMDRWRAPTVLAWLEIALGMPQYGPRCAENVKSGKVLLELSDAELECGLGIAHPMHRRKLRLAIEEHRHPGLVRYPCAAQLGHTWVSSEWLPDLGLAQYSDNFAANMVDARVLEHLSKRELEKYLGVTRKFHQASIVHGIHVLRLVRYDRQSLASRRRHCDTLDADPLVWTNQRFVRWARAIDLAEYADNLKDSGVHGGLVVLEPSFNGDTMANALGIPTNKNMIRRHLSAELETLVLPARSSLGHIAARPLSRSCAAGLAADAARGTGGLRGSLSRALGLSSSSGGAAAIAPPQGPALGPLPAGPLGGGASGGSFAGSVLRTPGGGATAVLRCSSEKRSPTSSSSGSSSVVSRTGSPPLSLCHHRGGAPGSDSPVYATPCNVRHSGGHAVDMYHHHHHHRSAAAATAGVENAEVVGPDGRRPRRQHRRVRSIGDIDMAVIPV